MVFVGIEELKWHQLAHLQLMNIRDLILVLTVQLKSMIKTRSSGRMVSSCRSDVVIASAYSEKTRLKKLMMIMNKSKEMIVCSSSQKLTSAMKLRPEK